MNSPPIEGSQSRCPLVRRLAATAYDLLIIVGIWMIGAALVVIPLSGSIAPGNLLFQLYLLLLAYVYLAICWCLLGQTVGMRAWRIYLEPGEQRFTPTRALVRFVVGGFSGGLLGLGFCWALTRADRATWHDLASGSILVIRTPGAVT